MLIVTTDPSHPWFFQLLLQRRQRRKKGYSAYDTSRAGRGGYFWPPWVQPRTEAGAKRRYPQNPQKGTSCLPPALPRPGAHPQPHPQGSVHGTAHICPKVDPIQRKPCSTNLSLHLPTHFLRSILMKRDSTNTSQLRRLQEAPPGTGKLSHLVTSVHTMLSMCLSSISQVISQVLP